MATDTLVALPLLRRVEEQGLTYRLTPRRSTDQTAPQDDAVPSAPALVPGRVPVDGEQYRFHVDMRKCIGCKCCVVACNEQNGNPASINWRRVEEVEGGWYPDATRSFLSMGCNHCLEPTCLSGCPVDAYTKDTATGIVLHSADTCIGCQYCTWNCSYGVPQFNSERGVVGKCDMCHGRLSLGQSPACVSACPTGAIRIEIVAIDAWRAEVATAEMMAGLPMGDNSASTTRVTLPAKLPPNTHPVSLMRLHLEEPHWPLVVMTVLTQLSVGVFATIWLLSVLGASTSLGPAALASLAVAGVALMASTFHLGRPIHAYRALKMWKRSWLSREVLLFSAFSGVACVYAAALWFGIAGALGMGALTVAFGVGGVVASAQIYSVSSRPTWNSPFTLAQFCLTAMTLGPLAAAALGTGDSRWLAIAAAVMAGAQLITLVLRFLQSSASDQVELQSSARLLATRLKSALVWRGVLLACGAIAIPLFSPTTLALCGGLLLALGGEILGRYLFFVTAVPKHMTAPYLGSEAA